MVLGRSPEYHWNQIILKSVHQFSRSRLKLFFYLKPWRPFCSTERNGLRNFCRQSPKEHSCIIISKSMQKKSFEDFSIFSSGGHLVQWRRTV